MNTQTPQRMGFACAYTPLPIIDAAGFVPFRVLPMGDAPDQAGSFLHDNICPHVKRVLDRALGGDVPELAGVVLMNSCDAMRRVSDAWATARPADRVITLDLPIACDDTSVAHFKAELARLMERLSEWSGRPVTVEEVVQSVDRYNALAAGLERLADYAAVGALSGGHRVLQEIFNRSVTRSVDESLTELDRLAAGQGDSQQTDPGVPVLLFGNVLPDPEALELLEACGCRVVADDVCTGSRQLVCYQLDGQEDPLAQLAHAILSRPACARTLVSPQAGLLAGQVAARARECGAKGAIAHVMKFCDPYLARLPAIRDALREAGLPLLVLEGDCTLRSLGQHRTRIEAFVEMLGGSPP